MSYYTPLDSDSTDKSDKPSESPSKSPGTSDGKSTETAHGITPEKSHIKSLERLDRKLPYKFLGKFRGASDSASARGEIEHYHSTKIDSTDSEDFERINIFSNITGLDLECSPDKSLSATNVTDGAEQKAASSGITPKIAQIGKPKRVRFKEREETVHDRLYNACLTGDLNTVKDILAVHYTTLMQDEQGQTPLYAACIGNQPEIIEFLLEYGYVIDHQDNDGKTPLHIAFEWDEPATAMLLLDTYQASYKIRDVRNWTPFHYAIDQGYYDDLCSRLSRNCLEEDANTDVSWIQLLAACHDRKLETVEFLLATNAEVNHVSSFGHTALHVACIQNDLAIVKLLLQNGAQETINHRSASQDLAPIHTACVRGNASMVQQLLEYGADPNITCVKNKTPCHIAVAEGNTEILQCLLRCSNININAVNCDGDTCLQIAVNLRNLEIVTLLLSHGVNVNISNFSSLSPLHVAVRVHEDIIAQKLLQNNADPNLHDSVGNSCLQLALYQQRQEVVPMMLKAGANVSASDKDGDSCLHLAIHMKCNAKTIQLLIEHGAPLEERNNEGLTALLLASRIGHQDAIQVLLNSDCDPNVVDEDGDSVLHHAIREHCDKCTIQAIVDRGANIDILNNRIQSPLVTACREENHAAIRVLLDAKADPGIADMDGDTALHNAIYIAVSQHVLHEIVLLCKQADLDAVNNYGESALMIACRKGQNESVLMLLKAGTSTAQSDADGDTCLHNAVREVCKTETVQALLDHGASLNAINFNGDSPIHVACEKNDRDKVSLLLKHGANPENKNNDGHEPLGYAVRANSPDLLEAFFIHSPALLNMTIDSCETALHYFCRKGKIDMVAWMLSHGVDKDKVCVEGSPLDLALSHGRRNIVFMLLDAGANVSMSPARQCFVERIYQQRHLYMDILIYIVEKNCNVDFTAHDTAHETLFFKACRDEAIDVAEMLLVSKHDIGINICNNEGQTPVAIICANAAKQESEALTLLSMVVNSGRAVDVDTADHKKTTPLHLVCQENKALMVNLILRKSRGSVNARDSLGRTPLQLAKTADVINLLVTFGATKD